ncbi:MAG: GHKL domain-containing protein, partial [Malacoplasma sp.]
VENIHQPKIEVELLSQEKMLIILVKNPINQKPIRKNGHYLSTKIEKGHGLGLKNVKKAVEKYGGSMDIQIDKGMFVVKILMPMVRGSYENKDKSNKSVQDKNWHPILKGFDI